MARILRGDIVWANLEPTQGNEQRGRRPVVVVSQDIFNQHSGTVIAIALTSQPQKASFPLTLKLESTKLLKESWIKISQIRTLSIKRIGKRIGQVSVKELSQIIEGLNEIIA